MNPTNPPDLLSSAIACPKCQRQAIVSGVHSHGQIKLLIFICECGAVLVLGMAPTVELANASTGENAPKIPILVLSDKASTIIIPQISIPMSKRLRS